MLPLDSSQLDRLPARCERPGYDRQALSVGIIHLGVGAFHRAHQGVLLDRCLAQPGQQAWGLCGVGLRASKSGAAMAEALAAQDGLYTVHEMDADGGHRVRVVENLIDYVFTPEDSTALLERLADPAVKIVSMTITEGGYLLDPDGKLELDHPEVRHDLDHRDQPRHAYGYLVEALARRRAAGAPGFTVLSCDNLRGNGKLTRAALLAFAAARDSALADWIAAQVSFPNAMVDRITPAVDDKTRQRLNAVSGVDDRVPVICEAFAQWIIEDDFCQGRPRMEEVDGILLVEDVTPYEEAKIRLLNAGHSMLAYPALLLGHERVDQAMADPALAELLGQFMRDDAAPDLSAAPGLALDDYQRTLLERFSNPAVGDELLRIGSDGGSKLSGFVRPTLEACLAAGRDTSRLALLYACYAHCLLGKSDQGETLELKEPVAGEWLAPLREGRDFNALLDLKQLIGARAAGDESFARAYRDAYAEIDEHGARAILDKRFTAPE